MLGREEIDVTQHLERSKKGVEPNVVALADELITDGTEVLEELADEVEARKTRPLIGVRPGHLCLREKRAQDLLEHPDVAAQPLRRVDARNFV